MKRFICVLLLFVFVGCATTPVTIQQLEQKTKSSVLTEVEVRDLLVGKNLTMIFSEYGNPCTLLMTEDGSAKGSSPNTSDTGKWSFTTTEGGLPVLVLNWKGSWGIEKGTVIEKNGRLNMVSPYGINVFNDIEVQN